MNYCNKEERELYNKLINLNNELSTIVREIFRLKTVVWKCNIPPEEIEEDIMNSVKKAINNEYNSLVELNIIK